MRGIPSFVFRDALPVRDGSEVSLTSDVLRHNALRATGDGLELDLRLPWYRSLPVSCVERVEVCIAGHAVPGDRMRFAVGGRVSTLAELAERRDDWFVLEPATILIHAAPHVRRGDTVPVSVRLDCRIPYILVGPDRAL